MKNKNIGLGVFLLSIGAMWLLINMGVISWQTFNALFVLWPLILVLIGVNVIFKGNEIVKAIAWIGFLAVIITYGYFTGDVVSDIKQVGSPRVVIEKLPETKRGELEIAMGGVGLNIDAGDVNLIDVTSSQPDIKHSIKYARENESASIQFERSNFFKVRRNWTKNECTFTLNEDVLWDIDVNVGAVNGTLDMSKLKVRELDLDMGAGSLKLLFGTNNELTNVKIDAGASRVQTVVPREAGVRVIIDGALNKTNLNGLGWERKGNYYESPNYSDAVSKIHFDIDMGVGEFTINQK